MKNPTTALIRGCKCLRRSDMALTKKTCKECGRPAYAKQLCAYHYKAKQPVRPRKFVNRISYRRKLEQEEYSKLRKEFLLTHPMCQGQLEGCTSQATEIHHAAKREFYLRVDTFRALCHSCHKACEKNRRMAESLGLTLTIEQIRKLREET